MRNAIMFPDRYVVMSRRNSAKLSQGRSAGMSPACNASQNRRGFPDRTASRYLFRSVRLLVESSVRMCPDKHAPLCPGRSVALMLNRSVGMSPHKSAV